MRARDTYERRWCRESRTHVILAAPGIEADEDEGWTLICDEHAGAVQCETRAQAESYRAHPQHWCPTCQEQGEE